MSERKLSYLLIFLSIGMMSFSIFISTQRKLTSLENTLFQTFSLTAGLAGSYVFGKHSAKDAASELVKPYGRSAFRRLVSLYRSLSRMAYEIESYNDPNNNLGHEIVLAKLESMVIDQIATANDALDDWKDIVPEEVEELNRRLTEKSE